MIRLRLLVLFFFAFSQVSPAQQRFAVSAVESEAMKHVTIHSLLGHIRFLSHDLLEGRAPSTRGDKLARAYIAGQMESLGLEPAGDDGTYIQRFPIFSLTPDPSMSVTIRSRDSTVALTYGEEFVGVAGRQLSRIDVKDADILFVGHGIVAPEMGWDDYKNTDVRDKILLFLNDDPPSDDPHFFRGKARTYYGRWTYKCEIAAQKEAAGAIVIHTKESAGYGWNGVRNSWTGEQFELEQAPNTPTTLINGWTSHAATERLLHLAGHSLDELMKRAARRSFKPLPLELHLSASLNTTIKRSQTANVIGVLPGSDPQLQQQGTLRSPRYHQAGKRRFNQQRRIGQRHRCQRIAEPRTDVCPLARTPETLAHLRGGRRRGIRTARFTILCATSRRAARLDCREHQYRRVECVGKNARRYHDRVGAIYHR